MREKAAVALGRLEEKASPAIPKILARMDDEHPRVRYAATIALGRIGGARPDQVAGETLTRLVEALDDESTAKAAVWALARLGPHCLTAVVEGLQHESVERAAGAAQVLAAMGQEAAPVSDALVLALRREHSSVRLEAARALGATGELAGSAVDALVSCLESDGEPTVRAAAAGALGAGAPPSERVVEALQRALKGDDSAGVRASAAQALASAVVFAGGELLTSLLEALEDVEASVRIAAAETLGAWAESLRLMGRPSWESSPRVIDLLVHRVRNDADEFVRRASLLSLPALVHLTGEETDSMPNRVDVGLREALAHDHWSTREAAVRAAGEIGPRASALLPLLIERMHDPHLHVREAAARAIEEMPGLARSLLLEVARRSGAEPQPGQQPPILLAVRILLRDPGFEIESVESPDELVPALVLALRDPYEPEVRAEAARCLGVIGAPDTMRELLEGLGDEAPRARASVAEALGGLGASAGSATPRLVELLEDDPEPEVRAAAARALGRIGRREQEILRALRRASEDQEQSIREAAVSALESLSGE